MAFLDDFKQMLGGSKTSDELQSVEDQTQEEKDLASFVNKRLDETRNTASRVAHEGIWMTNVAYVLGYNGLYYDTAARQFRPTGGQSIYVKRNRLNVNKILPTVQNRQARLAKNPPKYDVRPGSTSNDDKDAARLSLQVLTQIWDTEKVNRKRLELLMWTQQCGHAYVKVSFDPERGEIMTPVVDPQTQPGQMTGQDNEDVEFEGEVSVEVVSPFEIFPDPLAKNMDEAQWFIQAKVRKLDYFKARYPERGSLVKEEGITLLSAQYESRINSMNTQGLSGGNADMRFKNCALEKILYERRSKKYPNGRLIVTANGVILENKALPVGKIPLVKFDDILIGGKFYSESIVTHMRPIQDQYNRTIQKRAEWVNALLAGKLIAPRGGGLTQEALNNTTEVVYYDAVPNGGPPQALTMPNIPQYAYTEDGVHEKNLNDISGISEVSRGTLPSASIPALGMQLLVEQDDSRIGVITEQHEEAWAQVGKLILMYVEKCYKTPRILKIAGDGLEYAVQNFLGADLKGNHDVIVIRGSTLPGSKALRRQELLNAYSQGLLGDPNDPAVKANVLSMLEYGDTAEIWKDRSLDMAIIQKNIKLIEGSAEMPKINKLDNHGLAIQELNRYRKTDKYDSLDPYQQSLILALVDLHKLELMKLADPSIDMGPAPQPPEMQDAQAQESPAGNQLAQTIQNHPATPPQQEVR